MATKKLEAKAEAPVTRRRVVASAAAPAAQELAPPPAAAPAPAGPTTNGPPDETSVAISAEAQARIDSYAKLADGATAAFNPAHQQVPAAVEKAPELTVSAAESPAAAPAPEPVRVEVPVSAPDQEMYERFNAEPHVKCLLPKDVQFTLPNHQIKQLKAGVRMLPRSWATHWYMVASGVTVV